VVSILPRPRALREVRVVDRLLCADTSRGVVHQHAFEEVQAVFAKNLDAIGVDHLVILLPLPLGETALEVWERLDTWPVGLSGSAEDAEDLEDFVDLGVTGEERLAGRHLGEDAADGPHVDTSGVLTTTEKDLRCAVPESDDFVCVGTERDTECASQTEISQLQVALLVDEQVLRLEVAMQDAVGVAVAGSLQELKGELLDLRSCQHAGIARTFLSGTLTMSGPRPMCPWRPFMTPSGNGLPRPPWLTGNASMYFFRSKSRYSKTR